ncbi:BsuPI-related putative proteinase inhibitor [Shewanella algidipiscicola]|uniref:BsuPI-related putative proteinase inhibitor n=1 Tax=Shewanella algidipiscicola TaxID=614070 RepID=UPI000E70BB8B|nr:BsuPI-related putative proteinase inhibitor [Shewanella algidipiscicola]
MLKTSVTSLSLLLFITGCAYAEQPVKPAAVSAEVRAIEQANSDSVNVVKGQSPFADRKAIDHPTTERPMDPQMPQKSLFKGELTSSLVDKGLQVTLMVSNPNDYGVPIQYRSGMTADLWVVDADGKRLWAWSDEMMFTQALRDVVIAPHQQVKVNFMIPESQLVAFPADAMLLARYDGVATESSEQQVALVDISAPLTR